MANVLFIDIPILNENNFGLNDLVVKRRKAQNCINLISGIPVPYESKNTIQFSRGLLVLSAFLKNNSEHETVYINYEKVYSDNFYKILNNIDFVCIPGNNTAYIEIVKDIAKIVKIKKPTIKIIVGGYHVTYLSREVLLECSEIDYIVRGEGEKTLLDIINGKKVTQILGLAYRSFEKIVINPDQILLKNNELEIPDYTLLPEKLKKYSFNVQSIRGCLYRCSYCTNGFFWKKPRAMPIESLWKELEFLNSELERNTMIHFSDNIFTLNKKRAINILKRIIKSNFKLLFSCDIRAGYIDKELVKYMEDAKFIKISIGFEDADDRILSLNNKGISFYDNIATAKVIKDNSGIFIEAYWIVGLPGTDEKSINTNINMIKYILKNRIVDTVSCNTMFTPLPGSPIFIDPSKFGVKYISNNWSNYIRSKLNPVCVLENVSNERIKMAYVQYENTILNEYCYKLNCSISDLDELHNKINC